MSTDVRQYDVCLSFASENGEYVQRVYELLKKKKIDVYFYKATRAKAWGRSLTSYLENVYRHQSKFCVIFLSKDYARKAWTQHELKSALVRAFEQNREYLLPVRFDDTKLPDLPDDVVYESSETPPKRLAELIVEKIRDLPESTSPEDATSRAKCWNCAGWLNAGAKQCIVCHHYQDWRRYFHIIAAFLQQVEPLIKLIAGIAVVVTALLYVIADSHTTARFAGADPHAIELYVSNQGWKRSHIRRSVLEFPEPKMILDAAAGPDTAVIATISARDENERVRLDVSGLARGIDQASGLEYDDEQIQEWLSRTKVRLWVEIQESDGTRQDPIDIDGEELEPLVTRKLRPVRIY